MRADGAADLDARYTLETDRGRLIQVQSRGLRFETGAPELDWLNRVIAVAKGARLPRAVQLTAFEVL